MVYMSKAKRRRVMRKRVLGLSITVVVIIAFFIMLWQIGLGGTVATVNGASIRSGAVNGLEAYLSYTQGGYFPDYSTRGLSSEEKAEVKDMALMQRNYTLNSVLVPLELLKQHFAAEGTAFPSEESAAQIKESVDNMFMSTDTARALGQNKVKKEHITAYYEYMEGMQAFWDEVVEADPVTDEEAQEYYDENEYYFVTPFSMQASHILIQDPEHTPEKLAEIEAILDKIDAGEDFAELAMEYSEDGSAESGGDLGSFGLGQMVAPFEEACLELEPGEVSGVVESEFGFHIIKMTSKTEESVKTLEEVRDTIDYVIGSERVNDAVTALEEAADIVYKGLVCPSTGKPPISQEELDEARGIVHEDDEYDPDEDMDSGDFDINFEDIFDDEGLDYEIIDDEDVPDDEGIDEGDGDDEGDGEGYDDTADDNATDDDATGGDVEGDDAATADDATGDDAADN